MQELMIGGLTAKSLAETYQTPLYVYDEGLIEEKMQDLKKYFVSDTFATKVLYASKAFQTVAMLNLAAENGLGLDVVSGGEIFTATKSKMSKKNVYFHGNNKGQEELSLFISEGFSHVVVDNLMEAQLLATLAKKFEKEINVMIRLNVGVEAHTHKYILTSYVDSKFGVAFESDEAKGILQVIENSNFLTLEGFHAHIGSQIFELTAWEKEIEKLVSYLTKFEKPLSLNLGGGFGISYTKDDQPIPLKTVAHSLIAMLEKELKRQHVSLKEAIIEPGRSIVGSAGTTLYTVGFLKETPHKKYAFVDGGMTDNIRPALYQATYSCDLATDLTKEKTTTYTIAGKMCESGDVVIEKAELPELQTGDLLAVYATGAYGYSMSSNYNRALTPAVVFVKDGQSRVVVKRQEYEDLLRNEVY